MQFFLQWLRQPANYFSVTFWIKWVFLSLLLGIPIGLASGGFLITLEWATNFRKAQADYVLWALPLAGLFIGWGYHKWGQIVKSGNNLLFRETYHPNQKIPLRMAPMVYAGTILTHFFGGSAGREGTAVQMGGAIADTVFPLLKPDHETRKLLITGGVAAGFAAVFGTPWAGALFAVEVIAPGQRAVKRLIPALFFAWVADWACHRTPAKHVDYHLDFVPEVSFWLIPGLLLLGILSGGAAWTFAKLTHFFSEYLPKLFKNQLLTPVVGGTILAIIFYLTPTRPYMGLGIPTIVESFSHPAMPWVFALKIAFTAFTLGSGFKGGEVTPLFFTGATLGSALAGWLPVDVGLLAAAGFVAVFGAATKTPIASTVMGMELFGWTFAPYLIPVCLLAWIISGSTTIYSEQNPGKPSLRHFY
jgi:H+/Cl- antiporter ClcA